MNGEDGAPPRGGTLPSGGPSRRPRAPVHANRVGGRGLLGDPPSVIITLTGGVPLLLNEQIDPLNGIFSPVGVKGSVISYVDGLINVDTVAADGLLEIPGGAQRER
jgi:hypothetical protein